MHTRTRINTHTHAHTHTQTQNTKHAHTQTHTRTHAHTRKHTPSSMEWIEKKQSRLCLSATGALPKIGDNDSTPKSLAREGARGSVRDCRSLLFYVSYFAKQQLRLKQKWCKAVVVYIWATSCSSGLWKQTCFQREFNITVNQTWSNTNLNSCHESVWMKNRFNVDSL